MRPFFHLDLFSGIGGFALAAQTVWGEDYHCVGFCEIDSFCQQTLRKNFPGVTIYGDIRGLTAERLAADTKGTGCETWRGNGVRVGEGQGHGLTSCTNGEGTERLAADAAGQRLEGREQEPELPERQQSAGHPGERFSIDLLTGGFPCQPFSTAGKRKGTEDDRFLWPEMFRVIRETKPRWVLGENVAGILNMALGQVCAELESLDYEVQCFVVVALLPTPATRDYKGANGLKHIEKERPHMSQLPNVVTYGLTGQETGAKLRLSPAFVEWMMGYPEGWLDFPMEAPSAKADSGKTASRPTATP